MNSNQNKSMGRPVRPIACHGLCVTARRPKGSGAMLVCVSDKESERESLSDSEEREFAGFVIPAMCFLTFHLSKLLHQGDCSE